jgi:hypothetical protein
MEVAVKCLVKRLGLASEWDSQAVWQVTPLICQLVKRTVSHYFRKQESQSDNAFETYTCHRYTMKHVNYT